VSPSWINDDQLRALLEGSDDLVSYDGVGLRRIGSTDKNDLRFRNGLKGRGGRSRTQGSRETRDRRRVSDTRTIIDIVGPYDRSG